MENKSSNTLSIYDFLPDDIEFIHSVIRNNLIIQDITFGKDKDMYHLRYRGKLATDDSERHFDQIANAVEKYQLMPLFRVEEDTHVVYLVNEVKKSAVYNQRVNLFLFILTLISVWITGGLYAIGSELDGFNLNTVLRIITEGWPFAISIIAILGAHEMGHYFAGRKHNVNVTLPYFIPLPIISPFGTMGAFINMKGIPKNKKQLFDIGVAGPLSGLIVAIPVLFIGLALSEVQALPAQIPEGVGYQIEGNSIFYLFAKFAVFGQLLPSPASFGDIQPLLYWVRYFFTSQPVPLGGMDVMLHQVAWAGWAGLLVTALNLIPIGQLDGGHILNALIGDRAKKTVPFLLAAMVLLGFGWSGWWFWAALLFLMSNIPAQPLDMITELDEKRKRIAILTLIIFVLVFIPVPIVILV